MYGDGQQIRDWLYVADHCEALIRIAEAGKVGDTYNIGGGNEMNNLAIVQNICDKITQRVGQSLPHHNDCKKLIKFVADRAGHDTRYSINSNKLQTNLGWRPKTNFEEALNLTIDWYSKHYQWWD